MALYFSLSSSTWPNDVGFYLPPVISVSGVQQKQEELFTHLNMQCPDEKREAMPICVMISQLSCCLDQEHHL